MSDKERLGEMYAELTEMYWKLKFDNKRAAWRLDTILNKIKQLIDILQ